MSAPSPQSAPGAAKTEKATVLPARARLPLRVVLAQLLVAAVSSTAVGVVLGAGPRETLAAALFAAPIALVSALAVLRGLREIVLAVSDGLLGFKERDYGLRLAVDRPDELGELVARFNELGVVLKRDKNDAYQREILLRTVLEAAPIALIILDEAGVVLLANDAARDMVNRGNKMDGQVFDRVLAACPEGMRGAMHDAADALYSFAQNGEIETLHVSKRYFDLNAQRHTLIVLKPLTRELMRQEVEVWKKTIRVIGHELNNSLAPISSLAHSARMIMERPEHAHRLGSILDTIQERSEYLKRFLEGYAQFARLPKAAPEEVAWGPFLERLRLLYPTAIPVTPPEASGWFDPVQLEQVLINLLKNAVESGSPPDEVRLVIRTRGDRAEIEVSDRGAGMSDDVFVQALLPFFTTKPTGSGLGLPLAREIVEGHGGRMGIERREGGGVCVRIELPGRQGVLRATAALEEPERPSRA